MIFQACTAWRQSGPGQIDDPWQAGMFCRSIYKEDGQEYEGLVKSMESSEACCQYAVVQFVGYNHKDSVWLEDLLMSGMH